MVQTDLKSDGFCDYNTAAAPFYWILDPVQNNVQYNAGEPGVFTGVGLHTPSEVIGVSSMIVGGGRDNYLTSCVPPQPSLPSNDGNATDASIQVNGPKLETQGFVTDRNTDAQLSQYAKFNDENNEHFQDMTNNNKNNNDYVNMVEMADGVTGTITNKSQFLLPESTKLKGAAKDYSSVNWQAGFSGNSGNLYTTPQLLTNVIERMWLERGGLDQNQLIKQSQEPFTKNTYKDGPNGPRDINGNEQMPTCEKIKQPYNIKYPFGMPINSETGEWIPKYERESVHFNPVDVESVGISSPVLNQNPEIQYNYNAMYSNGGCNKISFLNNNKMCLNDENDLTGVNNYNFNTDMPPPGLHPMKLKQIKTN